MKKALALVMAVCMVFSMAVMASAAASVTFTIEGGATSGSYYLDSGSGDFKSYSYTQQQVTVQMDSGYKIYFTAPNYKIYRDSGHTSLMSNTNYYTSDGNSANVTLYSVYNGGSSIIPTPNYGGGSSSGGGGGGGGGGSSSGSRLLGGSGTNFSNIPLGQKLSGSSLSVGGTTGTGTSVTPEAAAKATTNAVTAAVKNAAATGANKASAKVTIANTSSLTIDVMNAVAKAAAAASKGMDVSVVVNADTTDKNGAVLARMSIDVATALQTGKNIVTTVDVNPASKVNAAVVNHFAKYYSNKVAAITFGQKGAFGMNVPVAVKADLSGLNTASLVFYSYDVATNSFVQVQTAYFFDNNGYLHFTTPVGNSIVITDAPLTAK